MQLLASVVSHSKYVHMYIKCIEESLIPCVGLQQNSLPYQALWVATYKHRIKARLQFAYLVQCFYSDVSVMVLSSTALSMMVPHSCHTFATSQCMVM